MLSVLFQDDLLCIVDKPSGYVVHATRGAGNSPVMLQLLRDQLGKYIFPVHRLDRGTSGCISFAFSSTGAEKLQRSLSSETSVKKYTALCLGHPPQTGFYTRELTSENGIKQKALTRFQVLRYFEGFTLLELEIQTGRKHQIRRHLSFERHHIVGDVTHGKGWLNRRFREKFNFQRLFLHCHFLSFAHPVTGQVLNISCPLSEDLISLLHHHSENFASCLKGDRTTEDSSL